jgi:hypothetical protein
VKTGRCIQIKTGFSVPSRFYLAFFQNHLNFLDAQRRIDFNQERPRSPHGAGPGFCTCSLFHHCDKSNLNHLIREKVYLGS